MMLVRRVEKLTRAKSLFKDKKRFGCLIVFNAAMSLGNNRGFFRALAR